MLIADSQLMTFIIAIVLCFTNHNIAVGWQLVGQIDSAAIF
jgi:hypothetical protein